MKKAANAYIFLLIALLFPGIAKTQLIIVEDTWRRIDYS